MNVSWVEAFNLQSHKRIENRFNTLAIFSLPRYISWIFFLWVILDEFTSNQHSGLSVIGTRWEIFHRVTFDCSRCWEDTKQLNTLSIASEIWQMFQPIASPDCRFMPGWWQFNCSDEYAGMAEETRAETQPQPKKLWSLRQKGRKERSKAKHAPVHWVK